MMTKLNGSEKQIKWAEDIRKKALIDVKDFVEFAMGDDSYKNATDDQKAQVKANFDKAVKNLENVDSASWWIENKGKSGKNWFATGFNL